MPRHGKGVPRIPSEPVKESIPKYEFKIPDRLEPSSPKDLPHREFGVSKVPSHPIPSQTLSGRAAQLAVVAELLRHGCNAAIPEVDVGTDVFDSKGDR
jgi:hypothetical protein